MKVAGDFGIETLGMCERRTLQVRQRRQFSYSYCTAGQSLMSVTACQRTKVLEDLVMLTSTRQDDNVPSGSGF